MADDKIRLETLLSLIIGILSLSLCIVMLFMARDIKRYKPEPDIKKDTIIKIDTQYVDKPVPKYVYKLKHDTIYTDKWHIKNDTVVVDIPIERKVYQEDSLYRAVISGFKCSLDSLLVYTTTKTITIHEKEPAKRFSLGVTAGPTALVTPNGNLHAGIGVTAGIQYRF